MSEELWPISSYKKIQFRLYHFVICIVILKLIFHFQACQDERGTLARGLWVSARLQGSTTNSFWCFWQCTLCAKARYQRLKNSSSPRFFDPHFFWTPNMKAIYWSFPSKLSWVYDPGKGQLIPEWLFHVLHFPKCS